MVEFMSKNEGLDSNEIVKVLESGARVIARMIVNAVIQELNQQEQQFSDPVVERVKGVTTGWARSSQYDGNLICTVEEAGKLLGVSRATAYECAKTGQIPSLRFGKRIWIPRAALMKLLADAGQFKSQPGRSV